LISILKNKYVVLFVVFSLIGSYVFFTLKYYKHQINVLNKEIVEIKNSCTAKEDKLNFEIYTLKTHNQQLEDLINEQNKNIELLKQKNIEQRGQIAKYVAKYDTVLKEKQVILNAYKVKDNASLKEINTEANRLLEGILWDD